MNRPSITPSLAAMILLVAPIALAQSPAGVTPRLLKISAYPKNARIEVVLPDGKRTSGRSPLRVRTPLGKIEITASLNGYRSESRALLLDETTPTRAVHFCLDPVGQLLDCQVAIDTGPRPKQVAFTPDNAALWVTLLKGPPAIQIYGVATGERIAEIHLDDGGAVELLFNASGSLAYATQMQTASVYEIDVRKRAVLRKFSTGGKWTKGVALSTDESRLYVSNWASNDIIEFDLSKGVKSRAWKSSRIPRGIFFEPDGNRLFVAEFGRGHVETIELQNGAMRTAFTTGGAFRHFTYHSADRRLFASDMKNAAIYSAVLPDGPWEFFARTGKNPNTIKVFSHGKILAVSNRGANGPRWPGPGSTWGSVWLIDTSNGEILDTVVGGNQSTGLDVSGDGAMLAFSDFNDNRVRLLTVPSYEALRQGHGGRAKTYKRDVRKRKRDRLRRLKLTTARGH